MNVIQKSSVVFLPVAQFALMQTALIYPQFFFWLLLAAAIITDAFVSVALPKSHDKKTLFLASWPPFILILSTFGLLFIIEQDFWRMPIMILNALTQLLYMINLYYYHYRSNDYQFRSFLHMNSLMQILSFFSLSAVAFGLQYYSVAPLYLIFIPFLALVMIFLIHTFLLHEQSIRSNRLVLACAFLCITEFVLVLQLLPSIYYMNAYILTLVSMIFLQFLVSSLRKELSRAQVVASVILAAGMLVLLWTVQFWK